MKKVVVWGFRKPCGDIIRELKEKNICEIIDWFGRDHESTYWFGDIIRCNIDINEYKPYDKAVYEEVLADFMTYFTMQNRNVQVFSRKEKFYDYIDFFNIYFQFFHNLLISKKIDVVLFSNLPHIGPDYIFYRVAKALNIKTILFFQSIFASKFYCVNDINEMGNYMHKPQIKEVKECKIENKFEKDLFYMEATKNKNIFNIKLPSKYFWRKKIFRYLTRFNSYSSYLKNMKNLTDFAPDLNKKFVYFPLHLQPELTTATLGGIYNDQALALERLSELLPEDWHIYVKENPRQGEYQRGKCFFKRLKAVNNLKFVPLETDTYALSKKCQFVATVTGTVGWESITGGKPALIFGNPWYKELPGAIPYRHDLNIDDILNYKIDHNQLEKQFALLVSKMADGVITKDYLGAVENFDSKENAKLVSDYIETLLTES